jgi:hypothetical protein
MHFRFEETHELHARWQALRDGRHAPLRRSLAPAAIKGLLPRVFILGFVDRDWRFRLAGTELYPVHGRELTGLPFSDMWHGQHRSFRDAVTECACWARPLLVRSTARAGERAVEMETLLLPFRRDPDFADADTFVGVQTWSRTDSRWWTGAPVDAVWGVHTESAAHDAPVAGEKKVFARRVSHVTTARGVSLRVFEGGLSA